jgi:hypothetical protein
MAAALSTTAPEVRDFLCRVYDGRSKLNGLGLPVDWDGVRIVMAEECYAEILLALSKGDSYGAIQHTYTCDGSEMTHTLIVFGIQVEVDARLMPHEIRFRSEVTL